MTVENDARAQTVIGKLVPELIVVPGQLGGQTVTKVRGQGRSRFSRSGELLSAGQGMPYCDANTPSGEFPYELHATGVFRSERYQSDTTASGVLKFIKQLQIGGAHVLMQMSASGTVHGADERTLKVNCRHRCGEFDAPAAGSVDPPEAAGKVIRSACDHGWQETRDTDPT